MISSDYLGLAWGIANVCGSSHKGHKGTSGRARPLTLDLPENPAADDQAQAPSKRWHSKGAGL